MSTLDWVVVGLCFLVMIGIGIYSKRMASSSEDFFVGGGKVPWWLSGVSHHVSGHSGVVFVGYAGIATPSASPCTSGGPSSSVSPR